MICVAVREELTERALGSLDERRAAEIDLHLRECAACRREALDLQKAAATLGFALAPVTLPSDLEARVTSSVKKQADRRVTRGLAMRKLAAPGIAAAVLLLFAVSTAVVMVNRTRTLDRQNQALINDSQSQALERLRQLAGTDALTDPSVMRSSSVMSSVSGVSGVATAVATFSAAGSDVVVVVSGVSQGLRTDFPYIVKLQATKGGVVVGEIYGIDEMTSATVSRHFDSDVSQFTRVVLVNAEGKVLLRGNMTAAGSSPIFGG